MRGFMVLSIVALVGAAPAPALPQGTPPPERAPLAAPAAPGPTGEAPPAEPPLVTRQYRVRDVSGTFEVPVTVTASRLVDPRLLDYVGTQLRIRRLPRAGSDRSLLHDDGARIDPGAAEILVAVGDGGSGDAERLRLAWLWPDGVELVRPGVLRVAPELARSLAADGGFRFRTEGTAGPRGEVARGPTRTLVGKLSCSAPGATSELRFVTVRGGGQETRTDAHGNFRLSGTFTPGPNALKVVYDAPVSIGLSSGSTRLLVMDEVQNARSDDTQATAAPSTADLDTLFTTPTVSTVDCELWRLGVAALERYHTHLGKPPPAKQLRVKRWSLVNGAASHTYYDYIVVRTDFTMGNYAAEATRLSTIHHEFGHSVRHVADGDEAHWGWDNFRWAYARTHDGCEIFNTQYAFNEGWANYREALALGSSTSCMVAAENLDWNESLVWRRLKELHDALAAPVADPYRPERRMVELLEKNPGSIHSLYEFERKYCAAVELPNKHCTSGRAPVRRVAGKTVVVSQAPACPPGWTDDGATCRRPDVQPKPSYGRGAGVVPTDCGGKVLDAGLCYDACRSGFKGAGPVCWQSCPAGFRDDGAFCAKPAPYGRGGGYPWQLGDEPFSLSGALGRCEHDHGHGRCEQDGALIYPRCKAGFHASGCCICSPNCVDGMADIGVSCAKTSYGRGAGTVPNRCQGGMQYDAGLCYAPCKAKFTGVGPVCWGSCAPGFADHGATCYRDLAILVKY